MLINTNFDEAFIRESKSGPVFGFTFNLQLKLDIFLGGDDLNIASNCCNNKNSFANLGGWY